MCVVSSLQTPLRIPGLLGECLLVSFANRISVVTAHEGLGTSLWLCSSKLCMYQAWISLVIARETLVGVSKAKPRGHGGRRSECSQQPVKPGTQSLASWPGTWNTALGVICPLAGSVRLLGFLS